MIIRVTERALLACLLDRAVLREVAVQKTGWKPA